jgi:hypothetical protein
VGGRTAGTPLQRFARELGFEIAAIRELLNLAEQPQRDELLNGEIFTTLREA